MLVTLVPPVTSDLLVVLVQEVEEGMGTPGRDTGNPPLMEDMGIIAIAVDLEILTLLMRVLKRRGCRRRVS